MDQVANDGADGRPRYVNVLDCYLRKNLVSNGGYLDEIVFMVNTQWEEDQKWLDELIKTEPLYKKILTESLGGHFNNIWNEHAQDENAMYIKIDDDIVSCGAFLEAIIVNFAEGLCSRRYHSSHGAFPDGSPRSPRHCCQYCQFTTHSLASLPYRSCPSVPPRNTQRNSTSAHLVEAIRFAPLERNPKYYLGVSSQA